jgi:nitrogen fixation protein FixH
MSAAHTLPESKPGFRLRGWHVGAAVCGFFAVVIAVDATFTVLAVRTFPGEVSVTPYEDGLLYNKRLAQLSAQAKLGWRATAFVGSTGELAADIRGDDGQPVRGLSVTAELQRPATEAGRLKVAMLETTPGRYVARPAAAGSAWDVTVVAHDTDGRRFEAERRLTWP